MRVKVLRKSGFVYAPKKAKGSHLAFYKTTQEGRKLLVIVPKRKIIPVGTLFSKMFPSALKTFRKIIAIVFLIAVIAPALYAKYLRVYYVLWGNGARGDCIFIELPGGDNVLIDGGGYSVKANSWLDDFLDSRGVTTVNHVVLTHADADHSAGLKMVMAHYTVDNFYCTGQTEVDAMSEHLGGVNVYKISDFTGQPYNCYLSGSDFNYGPGWDTKVRVRGLSADDSKKIGRAHV